MFKHLEQINSRPKPFEFYTASELWTNPHTSQQMLSYHLKGDVDISSRNFDFIDRSVQWIVSRFNVNEGTKLIDFGCGPGLYTSRLAKASVDVTGIDFSPRSIQYAEGVAKSEGLSIQYLNRNYLEFQSDRKYHLILMIMCDFCALSPSQRTHLLDKFHNLLEPGGSVLLDVYSFEAFKQREETAIYEKGLLNGFWSPDTYYGFLNTFKYDDQNVVLDKYTIVEESKTRTVYNWLQHFSPERLESEFKSCGFNIENLYADVAGSPYKPSGSEFAVVARKS